MPPVSAWVHLARVCRHGGNELDCEDYPKSVVRGIQISLGVSLAIQTLKMMSTWWILGIAAVIVVLVLRKNRHAPAAIVLMLLGVVFIVAKGQYREISLPSFSLPIVTGFHLGEVWDTLLLAGFAQIPLTATNAVIATSALIGKYWPGRL